ARADPHAGAPGLGRALRAGAAARARAPARRARRLAGQLQPLRPGGLLQGAPDAAQLAATAAAATLGFGSTTSPDGTPVIGAGVLVPRGSATPADAAAAALGQAPPSGAPADPASATATGPIPSVGPGDLAPTIVALRATGPARVGAAPGAAAGTAPRATATPPPPVEQLTRARRPRQRGGFEG